MPHKNLIIVRELCESLLCSDKKLIPSRINELFNLWKDVVKKNKNISRLELKSHDTFDGDIIAKSCEILKTQPEHLVNTVNRFIKEINDKI